MITAAPGAGYILSGARGHIRIQAAAPEAHCVKCGYRCCDHIPLRYVLGPWLMHMLPAAICRQLRRPRRR